MPVTASMFPSRSIRNWSTAHRPTEVRLGAVASPDHSKLAKPTLALNKNDFNVMLLAVGPPSTLRKEILRQKQRFETWGSHQRRSLLLDVR